MLEWEIFVIYRAYPNVAYSFKDNSKKDSEGRKEKHGMNYSLKF